MVTRIKTIDEIIRDLRSKNKERIDGGIRRIAALTVDVDETHEKRRAGAKPLVNTLLRKLLNLYSDDDWETRYAAIRGLREIPIPALDRGSLDRMVPTICRGILDEDGRVRWAAVQALDRFRILLPDEIYVETYLELREMQGQHAGGVRRSIGHALERMECPYLRMLLKAVEYVRMGAYTEEVAKVLALEEMRSAVRGLIEETRESTRRKRLKMRSTPITPDTPLKEALSRYNNNALDGMARILQLPPPVTGLKKRELVEKISSHLCNPKHIEKVVDRLRPDERPALLDLMLENSLMPWDEFAEKHGEDLDESTYWRWHPPKTMMGRLKARGLIIEGTYQGKSLIQIPQDLRPLLKAVQRRSEEPEEAENK